MKIGIDVRLWSETGVGRYIRNLTSELSKLDKENEYILFACSKDEKNIRSVIQNSKFVTTKADIPWHSLSEQYKLLKIVNSQNLDLMHFTYYSHPIFYKKPFVVTIHDLIIYHFSTGKASTKNPVFYQIKRQAYKRIIKTSAKNATKIITPSKTVKEDVATTLSISNEKIVVTYEGVSKFQKNAKFTLQNSPLKDLVNKKFFLYVGNAYPHKNLGNLLTAFSSLKIPNIELVLVGPDDYFYKRLKKNIPNNCSILHNISDESLQLLYENAVSLVHPSLSEGFGLTPLEAMSQSCPALVSDIPVFKEICGDNVIYCNPNNADDICEKMNYMYNLDQHDREKITTKAKKYAENFTWAKTAEQTLQVYKSCTSLRPS